MANIIFFESIYSEPYGANMQCDYKIHVSRGSTINLVVTDLDMETDIGCSMDYLSVSIS